MILMGSLVSWQQLAEDLAWKREFKGNILGQPRQVLDNQQAFCAGCAPVCCDGFINLGELGCPGKISPPESRVRLANLDHFAHQVK